LNKHRKIVEKYIDRNLLDYDLLNTNKYDHIVFNSNIQETTHHINRNTEDNRIENLYIFRTSGDHSSYHQKIRSWANDLLSLSYEERVKHLKTFPDVKSNIDEIKQMNIDKLFDYVNKEKMITPNVRFEKQLSTEKRKEMLCDCIKKIL